jgi:hypothetical protein
MPRKARTAVKKDKLFILIEWLAARPLLTELTLTAITVLFGMQVLRVLIPDINWVLGNLFGLGALQLGLIGIAIFITGFLSGPLSWLTGNRRLITFTVAGLGLVRLLMQVSWDAPIFSLALAILGTILFILFLPAGFEDARLRGGRSVTNYVLGFLGGLALDTAINGAFGTYDVAWQAHLFSWFYSSVQRLRSTENRQNHRPERPQEFQYRSHLPGWPSAPSCFWNW